MIPNSSYMPSMIPPLPVLPDTGGELRHTEEDSSARIHDHQEKKNIVSCFRF